jgi:hypothetical protein
MNKLTYPKRKHKESDKNTAWEFLADLMEHYNRFAHFNFEKCINSELSLLKLIIKIICIAQHKIK